MVKEANRDRISVETRCTGAGRLIWERRWSTIRENAALAMVRQLAEAEPHMDVRAATYDSRGFTDRVICHRAAAQ